MTEPQASQNRGEPTNRVLPYARHPSSNGFDLPRKAWLYVLCAGTLVWLWIALYPPFRVMFNSGNPDVWMVAHEGRHFLFNPPLASGGMASIAHAQLAWELFIVGVGTALFSFMAWKLGRYRLENRHAAAGADR